jgi:hypothetical protein
MDLMDFPMTLICQQGTPILPTHPAQTVSLLLVLRRRSRLLLYPRCLMVNPMGSAMVVGVNNKVVEEGGEPRGEVGSVTTAINLAITPVTVLND